MSYQAEEKAKRSFVADLRQLESEGKNVKATLEKAEQDWREVVIREAEKDVVGEPVEGD